MPVVNYAAMPEFPMRAGITGKWIADHEHGSTSTSVLSNTVEPGVAVPKHFHEYEEIVLVEQGRIWVELGGPRASSSFGRC
jgi:quercetin dioxygenase-like cupin family protein